MLIAQFGRDVDLAVVIDRVPHESLLFWTAGVRHRARLHLTPRSMRGRLNPHGRRLPNTSPHSSGRNLRRGIVITMASSLELISDIPVLSLERRSAVVRISSAVTPARSTRALSTCSFSSASLAILRKSKVARKSPRFATVDFLKTFGFPFSEPSIRSTLSFTTSHIYSPTQP